MKGKIIGLDIGSSVIRLASIKKDNSGLSLESVAIAPSTPKGLTSEAAADIEALSEVIRKLIASSNQKVSNVAVSIPESQVYTKVIEVPQLSDQELSAALRFEMEQYVPLPLDQARTAWEVLGRDDSSGKKTMSVMIVAAPLLILEKYEKVLTIAEVNAQIMETELVSTHRALLPLINNEDSNMIVHMGATTTSVAICKRGAIKMVFNISTGGAALTRAVSLDLGIDLAQAENYKKAYGLNRDAFEGKVGRALAPTLDQIVGDIKKGVLLYREKYNNEEIKQVVLSGGSSLLPGLNIYFTNSLSAQVVLGNAWGAYNIQNVPNELQIEAPAYNVVVGLALRNLI